MILRTSLVAACALALAPLGAAATPSSMPSTQAASDAAMEAAEPRELRAYFDPSLLALQSGGRPAVLKLLEARHPELVHTGVDREGLYRFEVAPEYAGRIDQYRRTFAALGATVGKTLPSPRIQALYEARVEALRMGEPDVLGLIVKYRDAGMKKRASEAQPLAQAELERLSAITGKRVVASRATYGAAYATRFEEPSDLRTARLMAERLAMSPDVERVDLDTRATAALAPNDEFFNLQWSLGTGPGGIRAPAAWDVTTGSSSVTVAIVDTGILPHPDLAGRILPGVDMISDPIQANDGDGRDGDPTDAGDFAPAGACGGASASSSTWHGTHVAGIIGANGNNGIGIAGIDWHAGIVPVRALGRCGGSAADISDAIAWAAGLPVPGFAPNAHPARVINASLGGAGNCNAYAAVLKDILVRGSLLVAAAGNNNDNALSYRPASCALALTVSAVGPSGDKAWYSNYSPTLEISAPGGDSTLRTSDKIPSTLVTGTQGAPGDFTYAYMEGTSQAAPHVSGVAALMLSVAPNLSVAQMRDIVQKSARPYPAGSRCAVQGDCGPGILDAPAAIAMARALNGQKTNYSGLWWRPAENGWGINFQQQGDIIFGTWFTYGADNNPFWFVMPAMTRLAGDVFTGDVYALAGTPFTQINGQQARQDIVKAAQANLYFFDDDRAFLELVVDGSTVMFKQLQPQLFGPKPQCDFTTGSRAGLTNYQDLWWNPSESGWGVNLTQQGDTIFATWFTYGTDGLPRWFVADSLKKTGNATYSGRLLATTGKRPQDISGTPSVISVDEIGTMTLAFQDGEHGTMSYNVLGTTQSKAIQRQVWSTPQSSCH